MYHSRQYHLSHWALLQYSIIFSQIDHAILHITCDLAISIFTMSSHPCNLLTNHSREVCVIDTRDLDKPIDLCNMCYYTIIKTFNSVVMLLNWNLCIALLITFNYLYLRALWYAFFSGLLMFFSIHLSFNIESIVTRRWPRTYDLWVCFVSFLVDILFNVTSKIQFILSSLYYLVFWHWLRQFINRLSLSLLEFLEHMHPDLHRKFEFRLSCTRFICSFLQ